MYLGTALPAAVEARVAVVLPITNVLEEEGTMTNLRGRVQRFLQAKAAPGVARPTWYVLADLLTGSFVIERVFQIPGTGAFFVNSFFSRDYTMMMGMVLFYSLLLQVLNLFSDLLLRWVDPRVGS